MTYSKTHSIQRIDTSRWRIILPILLLMGAFTFTFLLGELVHEFGHYLAHMAYGSTQAQVHLDPFGGSHISGADDLPAQVLGVTSLAGPFFNLILGLSSFFILWPKRSPALLSLLLWGPVAMIQEGVTFSFGLLTPGGDAGWIAALGVPWPIILVNGMVLLIAGVLNLAVLLPLAGIEADSLPRNKLAILLAGMGSLMLVRALHAFLIAPESSVENLIPLLFSLELVALVVLIHQPVTRMLRLSPFPEAMRVNWPEALLAVTLGAAMFAFQILTFNLA